MRQAMRAKLLVTENNSTRVLHPLYPPCPLTTPCVPTPHLPGVTIQTRTSSRQWVIPGRSNTQGEDMCTQEDLAIKVMTSGDLWIRQSLGVYYWIVSSDQSVHSVSHYRQVYSLKIQDHRRGWMFGLNRFESLQWGMFSNNPHISCLANSSATLVRRSSPNMWVCEWEDWLREQWEWREQRDGSKS